MLGSHNSKKVAKEFLSTSHLTSTWTTLCAQKSLHKSQGFQPPFHPGTRWFQQPHDTRLQMGPQKSMSLLTLPQALIAQPWERHLTCGKRTVKWVPDVTVDPRAGLPQHQANSLKAPAKPGFPHPLSPQCLLAPVAPVAPKDILGTKFLVGSHKPRIWLNPVHAYCNSPSLPPASQEPRTLSHLAPADSSGLRQLPQHQTPATNPGSRLSPVPAGSSGPWQLPWLGVALLVPGSQKAPANSNFQPTWVLSSSSSAT